MFRTEAPFCRAIPQQPSHIGSHIPIYFHFSPTKIIISINPAFIHISFSHFFFNIEILPVCAECVSSCRQEAGHHHPQQRWFERCGDRSHGQRSRVHEGDGSAKEGRRDWLAGESWGKHPWRFLRRDIDGYSEIISEKMLGVVVALWFHDVSCIIHLRIYVHMFVFCDTLWCLLTWWCLTWLPRLTDPNDPNWRDSWKYMSHSKYTLIDWLCWEIILSD